MANRGTPDNTRGTVSPQRIIGSFLGTDMIETVLVPDNAATLIILCRNFTVGFPPTVVGVTSGVLYPVEYKIAPASNGNYPVYFVSTAEAEDGEIEIILNSAPGAPWYVISDAAVRTVTASVFGNQGGAMAQDDQGQSFVVPAAPGPGTRGHPVQEVQFGQVTGPGNGATFLAAPGAGKRYRIFQTSIFADIQASLNGTYSGSILFLDFISPTSGTLAGVVTPVPLSGVKLDANTAVTVGTTTGHGVFRIWYTTEFV